MPESYIRTPEIREKIRQSRLGKRASEETRKKLSRIARKHARDPKWLKRVSEGTKKALSNPEIIKKISISSSRQSHGPHLSQRKFNDRNHQRSRAGTAANRAVKRGLFPKVSKLRCIDCGKKATDYDHYLGYEDEHVLDIQPTCRSCNIKRAKRRNVLNGKEGPVMKDHHFLSASARHGGTIGYRGYRTDLHGRHKNASL